MHGATLLTQAGLEAALRRAKSAQVCLKSFSGSAVILIVI